jgi:hypothetical protein
MRKAMTVVLVLFFSLLFIQPLCAGVNRPAGNRVNLDDQIKEYINDITIKIRQTEDPEAKREILNEALEKVIGSLDTLEDSRYISRKNRQALAELKAGLENKYDELNGLNGFQRVSDAEMDGFALYVLQDLEQARNYITMSLGIFILILVLVLILA